MKLLLTSGGIMNKSIANALQVLVGKTPQKTKVAFIYTAANIEAGDKWWLIKDLSTLKDLGYEVDIVDLAAMKKSVWLPRIKEADALFVGGGNTYYLSYWFEKSGFFKMLPDLLKTKVYAGISAGSMIVTESLRTSSQALEKFKMKREDEYDPIPSGGELSHKTAKLVNFLIRPHLNSKHFPLVKTNFLKAVAKELKTPMYAIDDQTALKVVDGKVEVISEGKWKLYNA